MWALLIAVAQGAEPGSDFLALLHTDRKVRRQALARVTAEFAVADVPMALEVLRFQTSADVVRPLWAWLEAGTGAELPDREAAFEWLWKQDYEPHDDYVAFKGALYRAVDPRFEPYFQPGQPARIRLDEVRWGGVRQDGIPPLRDPWLDDADATWMHDGDVVFGLVIGDDARAFPKRILAWHELLTDEVGGQDIVGVYCTLCGSMIVYGTEGHVLGTSGFLYRSNKLMFDAATSSLWSTLQGTPVVGPLADDAVDLPMFPVVTTTWGEWTRRHPDTKVLSLLTGQERDYGEGAAYREYFATDRLMFTVPGRDSRLANKEEVLALERGDDRLALSVAFLGKHPVHHEVVGGSGLVVLTDRSGASRAYEGGVRFASFDGDATATDEDGGTWVLTEGALVSGERRLNRVPAHRAFWFGWIAAFPDTRLVR